MPFVRQKVQPHPGLLNRGTFSIHGFHPRLLRVSYFVACYRLAWRLWAGASSERGNGFPASENHFPAFGNGFPASGNHFPAFGNGFLALGNHFSRLGKDCFFLCYKRHFTSYLYDLVWIIHLYFFKNCCIISITPFNYPTFAALLRQKTSDEYLFSHFSCVSATTQFLSI